MSDLQQNRVDPTRAAIAALTVCIVQTLNKHDETFALRFEDRVDKMYYKIRDMDADHPSVLETLSWVLELLRK